MTLNELITYVDETRPNQYSDAIKTRWVSEVEHKAINEVFNRIDSPDFVIYEPYDYEKDKDVELLIPDQFDDVYVTYVYGKIDFTNSEIERYNNDATAFGSAWDEFAAWVRREYKPLPHNYSLPIPPESAISMRDVRSLLDLLTDINNRINEFSGNVLPLIEAVKELPEWVKQPKKPTYTAEEVGAVTEEQLKVASQNAEDNAVKRANTATGEALAGLELLTTNDVEKIVSGKGYQTADQVQQTVSSAIKEQEKKRYVKADSFSELPTVGENGVIYIVPNAHGDNDAYDEYFWDSSSNKYEKFGGSVYVDMDGYVKDSDYTDISAKEIDSLWDSVTI